MAPPESSTLPANATLDTQIDEATRGIRLRGKRGKRSRPSPASDALERNVDAVLRARGLALNDPVEKLLEKSRKVGAPFKPKQRRGRAAAKPKTVKTARSKKSPRPARGKRLRRR